MNINATELMLLNKKIKFGGAGVDDVKEGSNTNVTLPTPEENKPQTGMNALMFQGLNNVVSNPDLSNATGTNLSFLRETAPEQTAENTEKEYVAPYKSNIAFQGKANQFKTVVLGALMGLASLGAAGTMTSCTEEHMQYNSQEVMIDMTELVSLIQQMLEQQQITNEQMQQMNTYMLQLIQLVQSGQMTANEFYKQMFNYMIINQTNQEIIIEQLVQNGQSQEEANALIQQLINDVNAGLVSAEEAWNKIQELLGDIKASIGQFNKYFEQMLAKQDELIKTNKQGFEELIAQGNITNETLKNMEEQNDSLIILSNKQIEIQEGIKEAIEQSNIDNNANFDEVVSVLKTTRNDLIAAMMKLGYTQAQIEKMTAAQIIAAIEKNTQATQQGNAMLSKITQYLALLPGIYENGKITNAELQAIYKLFSEAVAGGVDGTYSKEMLEKLQEVVDKLEAIEGILGTISEQLTTMINDFKAFRDQYTDDKQKEFEMLGQIVQDNKIQTAQLNLMQSTQKDMAESLVNIQNSTNALLEIAKDDTKHKELIDAIKNIQAGGSGSIDYQKLEDMFKLMGMTIADAVNMSSSQLQAKIEEFRKTYVETEQKQLEEMQTITAKLDDLSIFAGLSKDEIVEAINEVTNAVNNGNTDITNELKNLEAQLDKLQATVDAMYKAIGEQSQKVNQWLSQFDSKFDNALSLLSSIDKNMNTVISNQTIANKYLQNLNSAVADLKVEIQKIQTIIEGSDGTGSGSSITLDQLEELWKQHDEANFNKYKELLENLDINVNVDTTTIEGLLKEINNKMDGINDNSKILDEILALLKAHPNYTDHLERIIEILENFKCNCDCGGNNEGILGDLEDVLA